MVTQACCTIYWFNSFDDFALHFKKIRHNKIPVFVEEGYKTTQYFLEKLSTIREMQIDKNCFEIEKYRDIFLQKNAAHGVEHCMDRTIVRSMRVADIGEGKRGLRLGINYSDYISFLRENSDKPSSHFRRHLKFLRLYYTICS